MTLDRKRVLAYRFAAQTGSAVLDVGVQDTGPDGAPWALAVRNEAPDDLVYAWTIRGAPHAYRRKDIAEVAAATRPFSEADAGKRIFDANTPLRKAGIPALQALERIADEMRHIVQSPMVKGEVSQALTATLPEEYVRFCRSCNATHPFEQTFRFAALQAGLELEPGTSPPVLRPIDGWTGPAATVSDRFDLIRGYLRLLGPAKPAHVASYLDSPVGEVKARWPADAIDTEHGSILEADSSALGKAKSTALRLLGPFDLYLQARDRELLVPDQARRKQLWPVLGRPGAVVRGGEIVAIWRPKTAGKKLTILVEPWAPLDTDAIEVQAQRLADFRGVPTVSVQLSN